MNINEYIYEQIAKNIKYYRKLKGLTQDEVAELTGYSPEYIRRIEPPNGKKKSFTLEAVYVISLALGVPIENYLMTEHK